MKENATLDPIPLLVKGAGIMAGEAIFAVNGPFLFSRFGLNIPAAAAAGCLLGALVGYSLVGLLLDVRHRKHNMTRVPDIRRAALRHAA